ncbi:MAG: mannose-1-phosphate guanylyltransferase/mannose-6-phosphate isomerase [Piscinibacter sp.]
MAEPPIVPVILAADSTPHLWPQARDTLPSQFMPRLEGGRSTFQATLGLIEGRDFAAPVVVTSNESRFIAAEQMQAVGIRGDIVLAPERGKPGAETAIGALVAGDRGGDAVCVVLPSDHRIAGKAAFAADCRAGAGLARRGDMIAIGLDPARGRTGAGHLTLAGPASEGFATLRDFHERPNSAAAGTGDILAETGGLMFGAARFLKDLATLAPDIAEGARGALAAARRDLDFIRLDDGAYARAGKAPALALLARRPGGLKVQVPTADWQAVDGWGAIHAIGTKDGDGNVLEGPVVAMGCAGSVVSSDETLTTAIGLTDMIVVATRDAVLVAPRSEAAQVERLVEKLKRDGRREASEHLRVYRPWGWYQRIDIGARFQVKRICVKPGGLLSLQRHFHRAEHWVVVTGTAEVTVDGAVSIVHENQSVHLPIGCVHRLTNPGRIPLELIEVQVGSYTGEDDIVRLEDIYART